MITFRQEYPGDKETPPVVVELRIDSDDLTAQAMVRYFRQFLEACTYHPDSIREALGEE